jgi:zinc-finger-containing domain
MCEPAVICPYCDTPAEWVSNEVVYGRPFGESHMIWLCRPCWAYVGCHQNSGRPKGTLANADLRAMRIAAHAHIDPLWQTGRYKRKTVYRALKKVFGREIHIGESDEATCREILALKIELSDDSRKRPDVSSEEARRCVRGLRL